MSPASNIELVRRGAAAFGAADVAGLRELLAPDVVHVVPGSSALAGTHEGVDDVIELYARMSEISGGTLRLQIGRVLSDGSARVIMTCRLRARRYRHTLDGTVALVCTVVDGRIARLENFVDDLEQYDDFWNAGEDRR